MRLSSRISISGTSKRRISNKALFALVFYLILPCLAITMIILTYPELDSNRLLSILMRIIPISVLLIIISQFQVRYERGSRGRFLLNELYVIMVVVWIYALLGGEAVIHQTWEEFRFSLVIWNYLAVILFITAINVLFYIMEYKAYRNDHLTGNPAPEDQNLKKEQVSHPPVTITTVPND